MKQKYAPDLYRNKALEFGRKGIADLEEKNYLSAIKNFKISNRIIMKIADDVDNPEIYDLDHIDPNLDKNKIIKDIALEIQRDLAINVENLMMAYYFLDEYDEVKKFMEIMELVIENYNNDKRSLQSYEDKASMLFNSFIFSKYINDKDLEINKLKKYLDAITDAYIQGLSVNKELSKQFSFVTKQYLNYLREHPNQIKDAYEKFLNSTDKLLEGKNQVAYLLWRLFTLEIIDNFSSELFKDNLIEIDLINYLYTCVEILKDFQEEENLISFINEIIKLEDKFKSKEAKDTLFLIFSIIEEIYWNRNDLENVAIIDQKIIDIMESNSKNYSNIALIRFYSHLIPALTETYQNKKVEKLTNKVINLLDSISLEKSLDDSNIFDDLFESEINYQKAEILYNIAINEIYLNNLDQAKKNIDQAKKYLKLIDNQIYNNNFFRQLQTRLYGIDEAIENNQLKPSMQNDSHKLRELTKELKKTLDDVYTKPENYTDQNIYKSGLKAALLLEQIESIPQVRLILDPNELLNFYFHTALLLDSEKDPDIVYKLLKTASTLIEFENKIDPLYMGSLLNDLAALSVPNERYKLLKKAELFINKNIDQLIDRDVDFLGDFNFNLAISSVDLNKLNDAIRYANIAIDYWRKGKEKNFKNIDEKIKMANDLIKICK